MSRGRPKGAKDVKPRMRRTKKEIEGKKECCGSCKCKEEVGNVMTGTVTLPDTTKVVE